MVHLCLTSLLHSCYQSANNIYQNRIVFFNRSCCRKVLCALFALLLIQLIKREQKLEHKQSLKIIFAMGSNRILSDCDRIIVNKCRICLSCCIWREINVKSPSAIQLINNPVVQGSLSWIMSLSHTHNTSWFVGRWKRNTQSTCLDIL